MRQERQKMYYDRKAGKPLKQLSPGDSVMMATNGKWKRAQIVDRHDSPRSYVVADERDHQYRRNRKFLRPTTCPGDFKNKESTQSHTPRTSLVSDTKAKEATVAETKTQHKPSSQNSDDHSNVSSNVEQFSSLSEGNTMVTPKTTRSGRVVKAPAKYNDYE